MAENKSYSILPLIMIIAASLFFLFSLVDYSVERKDICRDVAQDEAFKSWVNSSFWNYDNITCCYSYFTRVSNTTTKLDTYCSKVVIK